MTSASLTAPATSIAVDATGEIYALSGNSIRVFAASATGTSTPVRLITGSLTLLNSPSSIAVDSAQNIYVANTAGDNVLVFSSTATGNVAPASILAGTTTQISTPLGVASTRPETSMWRRITSPATPPWCWSSLPAPPAMPPPPGRSPPSPPIPSPAWRSMPSTTFTSSPRLPRRTYWRSTCSPRTSPAAAAPVETITTTSWTASNYGQIAVR